MKFSAVAGSLAALAGMLGKLGADGDTSVLEYAEAYCVNSTLLASLPVSCAMLQSALRVLFIVLMLLTNGLMLNFFVKGLHETDSLTATVTSSSVNFMLSAAGGYLLFQEHLPMQWFVGATIILIGMGFLLHGDSPMPSDSTPQPSTKPKQS
ncbi:hypothetical protein Poli38472_011245 [Pythium oligandrum]|uniref:EamA domain-containing protein n=1 Tax=Pythium oligandrum TaxID=41045 RepID=A0A8K1CRX5_PYTOL|nr:hypothetical protein Poli38472_011245 [Pythium oligandrum]|eukprot:TMW67625.1 hypothetical protein Poli38472_011245 [Pythium oligandrum]